MVRIPHELGRQQSHSSCSAYLRQGDAHQQFGNREQDIAHRGRFATIGERSPVEPRPGKSHGTVPSVIGQWIETYGYWALFLGAVLEGETVLIVAGYAISQGYLAAGPAFLLAVAGGTLGDTAYFAIGRAYGQTAIRRFAALRRLRVRAVWFLRRYGAVAAFATRFAYGLRIILPMSIGAAKLRWAVFLLFNLLGAVAFAAVYLALGYLFGQTLEDLLGRVRPYERWITLGLLVVGALVWIVREWRLFRTPEELKQ